MWIEPSAGTYSSNLAFCFSASGVLGCVYGGDWNGGCVPICENPTSSAQSPLTSPQTRQPGVTPPIQRDAPVQKSVGLHSRLLWHALPVPAHVPGSQSLSASHAVVVGPVVGLPQTCGTAGVLSFTGFLTVTPVNFTCTCFNFVLSPFQDAVIDCANTFGIFPLTGTVI